jgi:predicted transcriptional regulator
MTMASFTLAASGTEDLVGVICSFNSKWDKDIRDGNVSVVFRKKRLAGTPPKWLYVYLASPISAITARFPVIEATVMNKEKALCLADDGAISAADLETYAMTTDELFVIRVGPVQTATNPSTNKSLSNEYNFFPSPNFIRISEHGARTIDRLAKFREDE